MERPTRKRRPTNVYGKIALAFGVLMTAVYLGLGLFIIFSDSTQINLNIPQNIKILLGGTFILYGIVRFVRVYQNNSKSKQNRNND
ncbi:hypothetical protein C1N53_19365 [Pontibacter sp. SGAir0037]|nr:hypothetical protein C1N53_19365 [Pontibacter sp. SGAir0037]